jgi:glycolate oxidase
MLDAHIIAAVRTIVGPEGVFTSEEETRTYESDGLAALRQKPELVALPTTTEQVAALVKLCYDQKIPFIPRGSGTGLSGGALPSPGSIVIALSRMRDIL